MQVNLPLEVILSSVTETKNKNINTSFTVIPLFPFISFHRKTEISMTP